MCRFNNPVPPFAKKSCKSPNKFVILIINHKCKVYEKCYNKKVRKVCF